MRVGSLFAGIGGFEEAFRRCGIDMLWASEIDKSSKAIYRRHFPETKLYGDICELSNLSEVDLLCGGFPCQDVSGAGLRKGLKGERSGLFFEIIRLVKEIQPYWVFLENVPGLLTNNNGHDYAVVKVQLEKCGYNVSRRVFNSRYFGVPHDRRRVFIVGCLGGFSAGEILFEREGGGGSFTPSAEAGAVNTRDVAYCITRGSETRRSYESNQGTAIVHTINRAHSVTEDGRGRGIPIVIVDTPEQEGVRRLMPIEIERCFGFPDDWTKYGINENGREIKMPDTIRYERLGDSVVVPVVEWIAKRIIDASIN